MSCCDRKGMTKRKGNQVPVEASAETFGLWLEPGVFNTSERVEPAICGTQALSYMGVDHEQVSILHPLQI